MYVAISKQLISNVTNNIQVMRHRERTAAPQPEFTRIQQFRDMLEADVWGQHLHLKAMMPADWCTDVTNCRVEVEFVREDGSAGVTERIGYNIEPPIKAPPKSSSYITSARRIDINKPNLCSELRHELQKAVDLNEMNRKWDRVAEQVNEFLCKCKSLNEALKLWPHLALYIPKDSLDKVQEKPERRSAESQALEALKSINVDELTAAAVGARLA